jgi:hypothetical protein
LQLHNNNNNNDNNNNDSNIDRSLADADDKQDNNLRRIEGDADGQYPSTSTCVDVDNDSSVLFHRFLNDQDDMLVDMQQQQSTILPKQSNSLDVESCRDDNRRIMRMPQRNARSEDFDAIRLVDFIWQKLVILMQKILMMCHKNYSMLYKFC